MVVILLEGRETDVMISGSLAKSSGLFSWPWVLAVSNQQI
jgi:hypothetical protein